MGPATGAGRSGTDGSRARDNHITMPGISHPKEGTVYACPNCDSASQVNKRLRMEQYEGDEDYNCKNCGHRFDNPTERDAKQVKGGNGFNAKYEDILAKTNPEDIL